MRSVRACASLLTSDLELETRGKNNTRVFSFLQSAFVSAVASYATQNSTTFTILQA